MTVIIFTEREIERFWDKVSKSDGCWNWTASKYPCGYGAINIRRKCFGAHRMSWMIHHGDIPDGCEVCHHCDNPACVRPDHLYAATHSQNVKDMHIKGRAVCVRGDAHWTRQHPERLMGDLNYARKHPERMARGERNGNSKLSARSVIDIRMLYGIQDVTSRQLAEAYRVDRTVIMDVINQKTWRHVA